MFGWCRITSLSVFLTFVAVVFIYTFTGVVHYLVDRKHTVLMNEQLKKDTVSKSSKKLKNNLKADSSSVTEGLFLVINAKKH